METFNQEKVNQIQNTILESIEKFASVFPSLIAVAKWQEQSLQDYVNLQVKVEKHKERSQDQCWSESTRPEKSYSRHGMTEAKNKQLLVKMLQLHNSPLDYFRPSSESLIPA